MFDKILIANRGEIACRIIGTARRMGIACVAVYSEADRRAPFVTMADEAILIGPAPAAQSYLAIDRIIAACHASGAEAVHPGYGFLSENAAFAAAVAAAGLVFIGPNARALALTGDKMAARAMARQAGVAILPGHAEAVGDGREAAAVAQAIGFPVILKPVAGGGGKGMRIAYGPADIETGFAPASAEAAAAFGDGRLFIEKFIQHPRHIEIQILCDRLGNRIHLGERECSIQRRHQKIVEEAPSPFVDQALRARMGEAALALAAAVGYDSVGTVEFLVDPAGAFYFLEMNARLQVEHPVTELVTGVDLVEAMIRIAAGEPLAISQADVHLDGWAIESRIFAEDPRRGFLPASGRLATFRPPPEEARDGVTLRHDAGVAEGSEISTHYDPMIGKLITHAGDRGAAIAAQADALDRFVIDGIGNNLLFLSALMQNVRFRAGALATDFIEEEYRDGFAPRRPTAPERDLMAVVAASIDHRLRRRLLGRKENSESNLPARSACCVLFGRDRADVTVSQSDGALLVHVLESARDYRSRSDWGAGQKLWAGAIDGEPIYMQVRRVGAKWQLRWRGIETEVLVLSRREAELALLMPESNAEDGARILRCPMPGIVKAICVSVGQSVAEGEMLCVVEAMKMEIALRAETASVVREIFVGEGASLSVDAPILLFE